MALSCGVRHRLPAPTHPDEGVRPQFHRRNVRFCHPGYPDNSNTMLILPALDPLPHHDAQKTPLQPNKRFGMHHETARVACAILANARFDGYLSENKQPQTDPPCIDPDALLLGDKYYFHVPGSAAPSPAYPVVPSFQHFRFPHARLPPSWLASTLSIPDKYGLPCAATLDAAVLARDVSCRLTASTLGTEAAHLIPRSENAWFLSNEMAQYTIRPSLPAAAATDDTANAILLSSHIHATFDQRCFAIAPKWGRWVIHTLIGTPAEELTAVYHNVELQQLTGLAVECIFARFAWSVVLQASFLSAGGPRWLSVIRADESVSKEIFMDLMSTYVLKLVGSKSRSYSPKKRSRGDGTVDKDMVGKEAEGNSTNKDN
ncbi:hypothetical protein A9K55_001115 [Cordyceps militaris]|uniref:HNH nuclease domain-containing protein n=1 Tax=Cordyceps militaris TaxID=73501 RepID=A0A2H4STY5_CORMI|nr:hypothetical protein A9K55_001115 [Cordyceps militaris]